ncbi:MAG: GNAT family N-acetyltransferase [candidate division Zixibacteria bacterium]|nr:GNAT family N-acetyltransferase [candidate division Zixibacteria bacterium]
MSDPSPYLLPEWSLFWEQVWPGSRAEIWLAGDLERADGGVPLVRRRRLGLEWLFSQPWGTTGGLIGASPGLDSDGRPILMETTWEQFVPTIANARTVEMTLPAPGVVVPKPHWLSQQLDYSTWILDLRGRPVDVLADLDDSHRRNIRDGIERNPHFERLHDADSVKQLQRDWVTRPKPPSRMVLNHSLGPLLAHAFSKAGALWWLVARVNHRPVATTAWLVLKDHAVNIDNAIDRQADAPGVNHALFAHLLQSLHSEGVRYFDFGGGPAGDSTAGLTQFKQGWGAKPVPRAEMRYRRVAYHRLRRLLP